MVEFQDQAKLTIQSVVMRSGADHQLNRRPEEGDRHPGRIGIVAGSARGTDEHTP
jgi:hypothetical protein